MPSPVAIDMQPDLIEVVRQRASDHASRAAYTFLTEREPGDVSITYGELDAKARAMAAWLESVTMPGDRVVLAYPSGLDFIGAFLGCIYSGRVAVPVAPPHPKRDRSGLVNILRDASPTIGLSIDALCAELRNAPEFGTLRWESANSVSLDLADAWVRPNVDADSLAFLQYTSGSTSNPKGVMVSRGNLSSNQRMIQRTFGDDERSVIVSWLPLFHDMGLIGAVLQPLWVNAPCVLMSPSAFLEKPVRWLDAVTRFSATTSGGPDFAYRLCVRKITAEQRSQLNLASWRVAFNGSERVRPETLRSFAATFESCGFRREAFRPCYGLAEATLLVAGSQTIAAERHELTGCGLGELEQEVRIVDPETSQPCQPTQVGEVWVRGPHVARGYWNNTADTAAVFGGRTTHGDGPYLRTGDLGFIDQDALFIAGRLKDLIIIRGRNYYPEDLEWTAMMCDPVLASGISAAFATDEGDEPCVVLMLEVPPAADRAQLVALAGRVRIAVSQASELTAQRVVFVRSGTLPRTTSGKIRRAESRTRLLNGQIDILHDDQLDTSIAVPDPATVTAATPTPAVLEGYLLGIVSRLLRVPPGKVDPRQSLMSLGLDSLAAAELKTSVHADWGLDVPLDGLLSGDSVKDVAARLVERPQPAAAPAIAPRTGPARTFPLSPGQRALWYLHQLAPSSSAYNIAIATRCRGPLDERLFHSAVEQLMNRHAALRTEVVMIGGEPMQHVREGMAVPLTSETATDWSDARVREWLSHEAHRPFDLRNGPLFRIACLRSGEHDSWLLFAFHHFVVDFRSLEILFAELGELYAGTTPKPPALTADYADFVAWQSARLEDGALPSRTFWREELTELSPVLALPGSHQRPAIQSYRGSACTFHVERSVADRAADYARASGVSLYSLLLAVYFVLLHRYTGQRHLVCGSPVSGRLQPAWQRVVGLFMNQVVMTAHLTGDESFSAFVKTTQARVARALAHQEFPLSRLVEELRPQRDASHSPLFQVMFSFYQGQRLSKSAPLFMMGHPGATLALGGLTLESVSLEQVSAQLDLTLLVTDVDGDLFGTVQYNTDLFDRAQITRMMGHFQTLLDAVTRNPDAAIHALPLLSDAERRQIVHDWNPAPAQAIVSASVQERFEQQAAATPDAIAVRADDRELSYRELSDLSSRLAGYLRAHGVGLETPVALCTSRSSWLVIGMLGILKAGAAFVPIDPALPQKRIDFILEDSQVGLVLTETALAPMLSHEGPAVATTPTEPDHLAYILYTSGSTGRPKGVAVTQGNLASFCRSMDDRVSCGPGDIMHASTSVSFDISILELLWPLTRGATVVIIADLRDTARLRPARQPSRRVDFSLFYFASADDDESRTKYRLLLDGATFADAHGFRAVWTPERHFHRFGGLFPNPAVTSAALATITKQIAIRAGSVVLPLHNPIRVAEEWSVVDNLSGGRVGIALASGWHSDDFAFFPEHYDDRRDRLYSQLSTLQRLWAGEAVTTRSGTGQPIDVRLYPKPIQPSLPIWITAGGSRSTFLQAGRIGANLLTHLLGQTVAEVADHIRAYRAALAEHGHDPETHTVTLMLHTCLGDETEAVRDAVREPFKHYLRSSIGLIATLVKHLGLTVDLDRMPESDLDALLEYAFTRYFDTSALFGTVARCGEMVDHLTGIGVDEIASLVDFGVPYDGVLSSLARLDTLKNTMTAHSSPGVDHRRQPAGRRLFQSTPSAMELLLRESGGVAFVQTLDTILLGGEALPPTLVSRLRSVVPHASILNMYGPTETTIWASAHDVREATSSVPIGTPLSTAAMYVLDPHGQPVPMGIIGDIYIGGRLVARGYHRAPDLTAQRFVPDPFSGIPGARLYWTGDLGRYLPDGTIEYVGRADSQVKLRGYRIELGEVEAALEQYPDIHDRAVIAQGRDSDTRLVAYIVAKPTCTIKVHALRAFLKERLPDYMVPEAFVLLDRMPLTANGKLDRKALPIDRTERPDLDTRFAAPRTELEHAVVAIWKRVLAIPDVGIDDNFFDLGGHSLKMVQVHQELLQYRSVPLVKLLEYPTVRQLAGFLMAGADRDDPAAGADDRAAKQHAALAHMGRASAAGRSRAL